MMKTGHLSPSCSQLTHIEGARIKLCFDFDEADDSRADFSHL